MRHHRIREGAFPCGLDRHGKREAGKIQKLRYISDLDAQVAQWGVENHAPDVGRPTEPKAVKGLDRFSALSRGPQRAWGRSMAISSKLSSPAWPCSFRRPGSSAKSI